jgi:hypothetical protein
VRPRVAKLVTLAHECRRRPRKGGTDAAGGGPPASSPENSPGSDRAVSIAASASLMIACVGLG